MRRVTAKRSIFTWRFLNLHLLSEELKEKPVCSSPRRNRFENLHSEYGPFLATCLIYHHGKKRHQLQSSLPSRIAANKSLRPSSPWPGDFDFESVSSLILLDPVLVDSTQCPSCTLRSFTRLTTEPYAMPSCGSGGGGGGSTATLLGSGGGGGEGGW